MEHECAVRIELSVTPIPAILMEMLNDVRSDDATFGYATARVSPQKKNEFTAWLLSTAVPENADGGDLCPLQQVEIFLKGERIFLSADYGRTIVLGGSENSMSDLQGRIGRYFGLAVRLVPTTEMSKQKFSA